VIAPFWDSGNRIAHPRKCYPRIFKEKGGHRGIITLYEDYAQEDAGGIEGEQSGAAGAVAGEAFGVCEDEGAERGADKEG
jgi:hypothetical protein